MIAIRHIPQNILTTGRLGSTEHQTFTRFTPIHHVGATSTLSLKGIKLLCFSVATSRAKPCVCACFLFYSYKRYSLNGRFAMPSVM